MASRTPLSNWARSFTYAASEVRLPASVGEVQEIIAGSSKVKALGTRHSFSSVADTEGVLVSSEKLNRIVSLDPSRMTVVVEAGVRYGELCRFLQAEGFALRNLASLPHISVAGACAT